MPTAEQYRSQYRTPDQVSRLFGKISKSDEARIRSAIRLDRKRKRPKMDEVDRGFVLDAIESYDLSEVNAVSLAALANALGYAMRVRAEGAEEGFGRTIARVLVIMERSKR